MFQRRRRGYRRGRYRWTKFAAIWTILLLVALSSRLLKYCNSQNIDCEDLVNSALTIVAICLAGLCVCVLLWGIYYIFRERRLNRTPGFATQPWKSNNQIITLKGKVTYVFADKTSDITRIKLTNLWRKIVASSDSSFRYQHQRFLLSSPELRKHESIIIFHNLNYNITTGTMNGDVVTQPNIQLKKGDMVEVQGVYIHTPSRKRSALGFKKTFYGKIHYTHPPKGYIKRLG